MKSLKTYPVALLVLLATHPAHAQCTGAGNTTITGANATGVGTVAWTNPGNIAALDGEYAEATTSLTNGTTVTEYLTATNLGFSINSTYTVCGVTVTIERLASTTALGQTITDNIVSLINGGAVTGSNEASATDWPASIAAANYGGTTDTWGVALTPTMVDATNFGVALSANLTAELVATDLTAEVDQMTMTVYSQPPVLALNLESFTVTTLSGGGGNLISWEIPIGMSVSKCIVERSADGQDFAPLDSVAVGAGGQGPGSILAGAQPGTYSYTDADPLPGTNYYRLHLLDAGGSLGYSVTAAIVSRPLTLSGLRLYPNPFHSGIAVSSATPFTRLTLRDLEGRVLFTQDYPGGVYSAQVPAAQLSPGLYLLSVDSTTYRVLKN
jgi:hypothetical protein